jgi:hypothetical protein
LKASAWQRAAQWASTWHENALGHDTLAQGSPHWRAAVAVERLAQPVLPATTRNNATRIFMPPHGSARCVNLPVSTRT